MLNVLPNCCLGLRTFSLVSWCNYEMFNNCMLHCIAKARIFYNHVINVFISSPSAFLFSWRRYGAVYGRCLHCLPALCNHFESSRLRIIIVNNQKEFKRCLWFNFVTLISFPFGFCSDLSLLYSYQHLFPLHPFLLNVSLRTTSMTFYSGGS